LGDPDIEFADREDDPGLNPCPTKGLQVHHPHLVIIPPSIA